jgi:hypothetical protein
LAPVSALAVVSAAAPPSAGALLEAEPEPPHAVRTAAMQTDIATARLVLKIFFIVTSSLSYLALKSPMKTL